MRATGLLSIGAFIAVAALLPGTARAACSVAPRAPAYGVSVTTNPTFSWLASADCARYRVLFSPSGTFHGDVVHSGWTRRRAYTMEEATWNLHSASDWSSGVFWRVVGVSTTEEVTISESYVVYPDWDADLDGVSVGEGDCDDDDPTVYPGAPETPLDGIDQDCNGYDAGGTCAEYDLGGDLGWSVASGTTSGMGDDYLASCGSSSGPEVAYLWTAPFSTEYTFNLEGSDYDTVLYALAADAYGCGGTELVCNDDAIGLQSSITLSLSAGAEVVLGIDGFSGNSGNYVLNIAYVDETICDDGADDGGDGFVDCEDPDCVADPACTGITPPDELVCDDGVDDGGDGYADCEDSDCVGDPACYGFDPAANDCANGIDSDFDGLHGCLDADCASDSACDTSQGDYDLGTAVGSSLATGSTLGQGNEWSQTCAASNAEDVAYLWTAPTSGTYTFTTVGSTYDTALGVWLANGLSSTACDDDGGGSFTSSISLNLHGGERVVVVVDGYSTNAGDYVLNISGP